MVAAKRPYACLQCNVSSVTLAESDRSFDKPMPNHFYEDPFELQHISDADHVRSRYRMYIGDVEAIQTPNCLLRDAFCLAIDQVLAKTCSRIRVEFTSSGTATLDHDGVSPGVHPENRFDGKSETEMIVSTLRFCQHRAAHEYVAEQICRNSFSVVNFLSDYFRVDNYHSSGHWSQSYARGVPTEPFHRIGACERSGMTIEFRPDQTMFSNARFDVDDMVKWFSELPLDHSAFTIEWLDNC